MASGLSCVARGYGFSAAGDTGSFAGLMPDFAALYSLIRVARLPRPD